jgi:ABC-2 type transport system permease protein
MNTRILPVLVRREFWEHRALWLGPLVLAGLYLALCFVPGASPGFDLNAGARAAAAGRSELLFIFAQLFFAATLFLLMSVVVFFYLADCLYAERKDRSILFWKSLPVSDAATVLSKVLVALLVVPLGMFALAVITNVLAFAILFARFHGAPYLGQFVHWDTGLWLRLNAVLLVDVLILGLWYLPLVAYQLLVSAWAKSMVFVWTVLPPLAVVVGERLLFGTWHAAALIGHRLGTGFTGFAHDAGPGAPGPEALFAHIDALGLLSRPELWIGVAAGAGLLFAAVRIRRYRDES